MRSLIRLLSFRADYESLHRSARFKALIISVLFCILSGCGGGVYAPLGSASPFAIKGSAHGGAQAISGASIQMYAMGTSGDASLATPLLTDPVLTDVNGDFTLSGLYTCTSPSEQIYLVATGGNPGLAAGKNNTAIAEIATLGPCGNLSTSTYVSINEATTIGAVWPLAGFTASATNVGSAMADLSQLTAAVQTVDELVNTSNGTAPGPALPMGSTAPTAKLYTLANIIANCINSAGGTAGDGSNCGQLFALSTIPGQAAPTNTVEAALAIAQHPTQNVSALFDLLSPVSFFQPVLSTPPSDWTLTIEAAIPPPISSLPSGTYSSAQQLVLSDAASMAAIRYTTDGTKPTTGSSQYTVPLTISSSQTVQAIATVGAQTSPVTSVIVEFSPQIGVIVTPSVVTLGASEAEAFTATATGAQDKSVNWTLNPSIGSLSPNGVYTAPASISAAQTVWVTATSEADPKRSAVATIFLRPVEAVAVIPGSVTVSASQTQQFTATVSGTTNTAVSWSLSPAVGSISATGIYMAPASIVTSQVVTITATSVADITKTASATVTLIAPIPATFIGLTTGDYIHQHPTLQFGTTRSWDAGGGSSPVDWSDINISSGTYNFTSIDNYIEFNKTYGAQGIYTFGRTPRWASSQPDNTNSMYGPGQCAPPTDISVWDAFVTALAAHVAGKIKYWEIWNEPQDPRYYCGDLPTIITMAQHAQRIIKNIDPSAVILSPAVTGPDGPSWLAAFLAGGGGAYVDIIAFHGYWSATAEDILGVIASYKAVASVGNVANLPLWDTEASWGGSGNIGAPSSDQQVALIPKYYLLHWSQGISRFIWYAYDGSPVWGGLETGGVESAAATSYSQTYKWLVGASMTQTCSEDENHTWICGLSRAGGYSAEVIWNSQSSTTQSVPIQYIEYRDLAGLVHPINGNTVTISNQPILLETGALP